MFLYGDEETVDNVTWKFVRSKTEAIVCGMTTESTDIVIPSVLGSVNVTRIKYGVFNENQTIKNVYIPDTVTNIEYAAFWRCANLKSVRISDNVRNIKDNCFYGCSNLTSVVLPNQLVDIGYHAFQGCRSLTTITLGTNLLSIAGWAFKECVNLQAIIIPDNVRHIGESAFEGCTKLKSVSIGAGVENINSSAFVGCEVLDTYSGDFGLKIVDGWIVGYTENIPQSLIIPPVKGIADNAFQYCENLIEVALPHNLKRIPGWAFYGCSNLERISVPNSVEAIEGMSFELCGRLNTVVFWGNAPTGISSILSHATSVYYLRRYDYIFKNLISAEQFAGYIYPSFQNWDTDKTKGWCWSNVFSDCEQVSLRSGIITNNQTSTLETEIECQGRISFSWKSSSEEYDGEVFDYAYLSIDGVPQGRVFFDESSGRNILEGAAIGGKTDWTNVVIDVVGEGAHTIRWTYCKDEMDEADVGEDCVWLDEFSFIPRPTISFDIGATASGNAPNSIHEFMGTDIAMPRDDGFSWADHVFDGWTDGISDYATGASFIIPSSNVTFTAKWIAKSFLTFDIGGGEGSTPTLIKVLPNAIVTLPTNEGFSWADHVFNGWTDGRNSYDGGANYTVPSSNVTLTAKWIAKSFVSFDIGEGTGETPETIKAVPNAVVELPIDNGFSWADHVFIGWDLGNWTYEIGTAEWNNFAAPSSNVTLTAHWLAKSFVSFDIGNGTGETPSIIKALPDGVVSLPTGEGLNLTDYAFGGWTDGAANYAAGGNYIVPETNTTLTAVWIAKRFLTFTLDGGDGEIPITIKDVPNATVTLPSGEGLSKPKYTFVGWSDGTQTYAAGAEYVVTDSSIEFSAVWEANTLDAPLITSADVANSGTIETANATIEISADSGAIIYYTLDGTEPTTNSIPYIVPFMADGLSVTIKAFAVMDNYFDSDIAAFSFIRKPYSAAECLNANDKTVSTGGNDAAWGRVLGEAAHDGVAALRSGEIDDGESSSIEMTVDGAGEIGYWWKSSSEISRNRKYDYISFLIDGVEHGWLGGEKDWTNEVYAVSGEGTHTLKWIYQKNNNGLTQGEDCAWLDEVKWTPWREITTKQTAVPIPYGWLDSHGLLANTDAETAAKQPTGKRDGSGRLLTVEDDFIAGTDPTNGNDIFTVSIIISNGVPVVEWKPNLNTNGENRIYTIYGKESLNDEEWITPTNSLCRFFKVGVAMPTKEENHDSTGGDNDDDEGGNESGGGNGEGNGGDDTGNMIPSGYSTNDVQCVSCTGSQWYDLGLPPTLTMRTQIKCSFAGENEHMAIIGVLPSSYNENDKNDYRLFIASSPFEWFLDFPGSSRIRGASAALNEVREVEFGNFYVKDLVTDSMLISGSTVTAPCPSHNIRLFRTNYNNPSKYTTGSVYYVRIYDLNASDEYELVRNLVPCKSDADEVGLLDLVEKKFYKSDGTNVSLVE